MRKNLPVTGIETELLDEQYLISKTDLAGRIVYANPAFVEVSGFSRQELIGAPHNIVRHPDMPAEVFADLWHTLKQRRSWVGIVKNRRKDGGFYWVMAHASPIIEQGELTGFASVRVRAKSQDIQTAEQFYQELRQGRLGSRALRAGQIVARSWRRPFAALRFLGVPSLLAAFLRKGLLNLGITGTIIAMILNTEMPERSMFLLAGALGAGTLVILGYQALLMRRVLGSFRTATHIAQQIAAGNLTVNTRGPEVSKLETLGQNLDLMRKSLMSISTDVDNSCANNQQVARQLSDNSTLLEARTHEQAASIQETTASMSSFGQTVLQTAENAKASHELASRSADIASRGNEAVQKVTVSMQQILESSQHIGTIVAMINNIAFQTNILSINASIESARAGEAGKGFAVVASAVRSLAQQAAQAADEIKQLVTQTQALSAEGADHAAHAGQTMQEILTSVSEVAHLMGEISAATGEQSIGLGQLTQALRQVDQITSDNAVLVQDLSETARELNLNGAELQEAISVLNHGDKEKAHHAPVPAHSRALAPVVTLESARRQPVPPGRPRQRASGT
ncbi:MAG TPA: methyl-accepting chemotaxis protein [Alcaligenes faecalis]|nr:methyl-accepting chemotaxis protein [Alcaligenes faecalis]